MHLVLVTGSDTGVGKTRVVGALARLLAQDGAQVQIVKVLEIGKAGKSGQKGDALTAQKLSGLNVAAYTLKEFTAKIAPAAAAAEEDAVLSFEDLVARTNALPSCDWRILEGVGGIATPIDDVGRDWADFAAALSVALTVIVVPDRLGAINQARLAFGRATQLRLQATVWLNAISPANATVSSATRAGLRATGVPVLAEQIHNALLPAQPEIVHAHILELARQLPEDRLAPAPSVENEEAPPNSSALPERCRLALDARGKRSMRGALRPLRSLDGGLNLADSDYLSLSRDPFVTTAMSAAVREHGTSASASPLVTGWREPHEQLIEQLCAWHRFPCGLLWNGGYAANSAVLGMLPGRGDLVLVDRQVHQGMITALLRSGARLRRYEHLNLFHLEEILVQTRASGRTVFVATESVFGLDGDYPDMVRLAKLKNQYGFHLIVDEAHAVGWYGPEGAGLVRAAGVEDAVDVLIGTLGKTLASGGAYTLFRDPDVRDFLVNAAGEFIYSTALPPANAAAAAAALARVKELAPRQAEWQECSRYFRAWLEAEEWATPAGDSPIVPVRLEHPEAAWSLANALRQTGVFAAAIRPPAAPPGTSRLRFSLKRTFGDEEAIRVLAAMAEWRSGQ